MLALLLAQEDVAIDGFEPRVHDTVTYWQFGLWLLWIVPLVLVYVGVWRYVEAHADTIPWKALRFWLPVQILTLDFLWWVVVSSTQGDGGGWLETMGRVSAIDMFFLNLPGLPLGLVLMWAGVADWPGWIVTALLIGAFAVSWHLFFRWLEARVLPRGPLSLFDYRGIITVFASPRKRCGS